MVEMLKRDKRARLVKKFYNNWSSVLSVIVYLEGMRIEFLNDLTKTTTDVSLD